MVPTVKILMSTYNGDRFIRDQLESILSQEEVLVDIDIRDDGSSDKTKDILNDYAATHSNIHTVFAENLGPGKSFLELLYSADKGFDYYAFSDQDDIWDSDKLIRGIKQIEKDTTNGPILYYSALNTFNDISGERKQIVNQREYSFCETFFQSHYPGCTMIMNRQGFELLRNVGKPTRVVMHDLFVVQLFMGTHSKIIYDPESRINYRIHGNNVSVKPKSKIEGVKRYIRIMEKQKGLRYKAAKAFAESSYGCLHEQEREILETIIKYKESFNRTQKMIQLINNTCFSRRIKASFQLAVFLHYY